LQAADAAAPAIDFNCDVAPIFVKHCHECHGPKKQEGGLRLDNRQAALGGGDLKNDLLPGKSGESLIWTAIAGRTDQVERMPLDREPLAPELIDRIAKWIDAGAPWPESSTADSRDTRQHWAFQSPVRPAVPAVKDPSWVRNAIDAFVLAGLDSQGLAPSPRAERATLLRRLSLDLIGLPPSVEELDVFLADQSDRAFERQLERLLASPHYGEKWGRHWLDVARYADSDGFEKDKSRNVWMYRDWVVEAFNRNLPYDQFVIEQIAGDQLPKANQAQRVATGFLRNSMLNEEGGIDPEQFRMEAMFDRMDALGKSVLGLTIQCCQCHNHKFDPITQEEYYRLFAFFNNDHEAQPTVYPPEDAALRDAILQQVREIEARLRAETPVWQERLAKWEASATPPAVDWQVLSPVVYEDSGGGAKLSLLDDQSMLCAGYAPTHATFKIVGHTKLAKISALKLELLTDPNLPRRGPGRSFKGTCALTQIKLEAKPAGGDAKAAEFKFAKASADFEQTESPLEPNFDDRSGKKRVVGPVALAIDGKDETAWAIDAGPAERNQDREAVFQLEKPIESAEGAELTISLIQNHGGWNSDDHQNNLLGRFRISLAAEADAQADAIPKRIRKLLAIPPAKRSQLDRDAIFAYWRTTVPEWKDVNERVARLLAGWPEGTTALVLEARETPRETHLLKRGDFLKPGDAVIAGVPGILHPLSAVAAPTRLTLARWLTDRRSPTTARVYVNRVWQAYFGTGIVSTSEDFGLQSEPPSHRELLDWLACEFMDNGWDIKHLHRLIVGSATYQQGSKINPDVYARDPYNRLLARGARVRVEGETVRDIALAASGRLNPKLGGASIYAPIPESLLALSYAPLTWNAETGPDRYRRALYTFRRRSLPYPALQNFDTPNGDFSCTRRPRSNTPLQALTTLNEAIFVECAQALAVRALESPGPDDAARLTFAFRSCASRPPTAGECRALEELLAKTRQRIAEGWINPHEIATGKNALPERLPAGSTPAQLAAYTIVARVLLNLDETITKE
jgi:mono/diheme cytochrome c family protein